MRAAATARPSAYTRRSPGCPSDMGSRPPRPAPRRRPGYARARLGSRRENLRVALERLDRALVLGDRSDVEPFGFATESRDCLAGVQQPLDQIRELTRALRRQVRERTLVVDVNSHAHFIVELRLLPPAGNAVPFCLDHAEVDFDAARMHGHG